MKLWKIAATIGIGVWASGSGMLQVSAADFFFGVDFNEKIVSNFDDYKPTFIPTTNNLGNNLSFTTQIAYSMNNTGLTGNSGVRYELRYQLNGTGTIFRTVFDKTLPFSLTSTFRTEEHIITIPTEHLVYLVEDNANFIQFIPRFSLVPDPTNVGRVITTTSFNMLFTFNYEFNNTYLFNYFLSDTKGYFPNVNPAILGDRTTINNFNYVFTTAGNDRFFILNDNVTDLGATRLKFAIDYENEYFRGQSVGARHTNSTPGPLEFSVHPSQRFFFEHKFDYYYLNISNKTIPLADVPQFNFEEEDCGSFLALNVGCFINNGLAYITNDAPIISDIFTLLNVGMQLGGQAFNVLGNFTDNNLIGVLVLGGAGLTAVRWFLKQD